MVVDSQNHVIRKVNLENGTSLFAGLPGSKGFAEGNGNSSQFSGPAFVISYPYKHSEHYYGTAYLVWNENSNFFECLITVVWCCECEKRIVENDECEWWVLYF